MASCDYAPLVPPGTRWVYEPSGGQRECARGMWCAARTVEVVDGERVTRPAAGPRAFCDRDQDTITECLAELPGLYLRLVHELGQPAVTGTHVHVPFGPSVPVRLDVEAAMRLTSRILVMWAARTTSQASLDRPHPARPTHGAAQVRDAARVLAAHVSVLLALQPDWQTENHPVPASRGPAARRGVTATCSRCGRLISQSAVSRTWWGADGGPVTGCEHGPLPGTIVAPLPALIPADVEAAHPEAEIVRIGADFAGIFVQRDGAAAGLDVLHLHYWDRAVLGLTPARPEELLGVECRQCSLLALRRADPPWFTNDPEYYSECASCGDLMKEDDYRLWVGQLAAYHRARLAACPVLATEQA